MVGRKNAMPMFFFYMWPILVGCPNKAKLWLILNTISKDKASNSLQSGLPSKQFP